jgi:carbon monoxide dehydrogenase subunit G
MADNEIEVDASPEAVWAVLADSESFDDWVIGAQAVRAADESWPAVGAKLHHRTGVGPLTVDDETEVEESHPPARLVLLAAVGVLGTFRITLEVRGESGTRTTVFMREDPVGGAAAHVPGADSVIEARNALSLRRLKELAEAVAGVTSAGVPPLG